MKGRGLLKSKPSNLYQPVQSKTISARLALGEENSKACRFPGLIGTIPVLLYHGNLDICCNYAATLTWLGTIVWSGKARFEATTTIIDPRDGKIFQTHRSSGNLTLYTFQNAGHLVHHFNEIVG